MNVPAGSAGRSPLTVQWQPSHAAGPVEGPGNPGAGYYWADEDRHRWESDAPSDRGVISSGRISVTLIQTDCTNHRLTDRLQGWARDLNGAAREGQPTGGWRRRALRARLERPGARGVELGPSLGA